MSNKTYQTYSIVNNPDIFRGYVGNAELSEDILNRLAKDIGISMDLYQTLDVVNPAAADDLVRSMSLKSKVSEVALLVDGNDVLGYSLETNRPPILNDDFIKRVNSLIESSSAVVVDEQYYTPNETVASVLVKKVDPINVAVGHNGGTSEVIPYQIGVLIVNEELSCAYSRLVIYIEDQPIYLPASYYNITTNRFNRSTNNSSEALEVLTLRVIDDLRDEDLLYKITDFHTRFNINKNIIASYEEYNTLLRTMMRIPTVVDDRGVLESLSSKFEIFERMYANLDDQKSSYIWRCTAMGDTTIGSLVHLATSILKNLGAPALELFVIRELLGTYLSTHRIAEEIAKEIIR